MKGKILLLSVCALLLINLAWVWKFNQNDKKYRQVMNNSQARFIEINRELSLMNRAWQYAMRSNNQPLPEEVRVQSADSIAGSLNDHIGHSKKLVLVLSDRHCSTCVDQLLFLIKNEIGEVHRDHLLILFSMQGPTGEQWSHRQKILTGVEFLEIKDKSLQLPMDSLGIPYFFLSGDGHQADLTFTPYPSLEKQTRDYLNLIEKRFFK